MSDRLNHEIPDYLGPDGAEWLRRTAAEFVFETAGEWKLAVLAACTLDRLAEARRAIDEHGLLVRSAAGTLKPNPASNLERDNAVLYCRLVRELRLNQPADDESNRIPRIG